ncbi:hypothetical protein B0H14DRAFT_3739148 [Mycena olivaceomarginata]|nr:hypothetical protein B0H14DRAFT_3739148 [Mycena olivaceomarginata]
MPDIQVEFQTKVVRQEQKTYRDLAGVRANPIPAVDVESFLRQQRTPDTGRVELSSSPGWYHQEREDPAGEILTLLRGEKFTDVRQQVHMGNCTSWKPEEIQCDAAEVPERRALLRPRELKAEHFKLERLKRVLLSQVRKNEGRSMFLCSREDLLSARQRFQPKLRRYQSEFEGGPTPSITCSWFQLRWGMPPSSIVSWGQQIAYRSQSPSFTLPRDFDDAGVAIPCEANRGTLHLMYGSQCPFPLGVQRYWHSQTKLLLLGNDDVILSSSGEKRNPARFNGFGLPVPAQAEGGSEVRELCEARQVPKCTMLLSSLWHGIRGLKRSRIEEAE